MRPLWEAQLMTVLRLTGIQSFSVSVKTPELQRRQLRKLNITDSINNTHLSFGPVGCSLSYYTTSDCLSFKSFYTHLLDYVFSDQLSAFLYQVWSHFLWLIYYKFGKRGRKKHKTNKTWTIQNKSLGWEFLLNKIVLILFNEIKSVKNFYKVTKHVYFK